MQFDPLPLEVLLALPKTTETTIPPSYMDEMGHMNIQYYVHIFNNAAWGLFGWIGMDLAAFQAIDGGMFALEQHIRYLAEVHVGEQVEVHSRLLGVSAKRLHFMHFMLNQTTGKLASTFEVLASYADLSLRRTAPFPDSFMTEIQAKLALHHALTWTAPVCGVLKP